MSFLSQPLQDVLIRPGRSLDQPPLPPLLNGVVIKLQVVVSEQTTDTLTVTKQPVQQGASITDHAYLEPTTFSHSAYFANNSFAGGTSLNKIYEQLRALQASAVPFSIITPKRIYQNMLMTALTMTTDKNTENCLAIHASYQQIILVPVLSGTVPRIKQKNPAKTGATQNGGDKSMMKSTVDFIRGVP